ncbi:MAG: acyltransferase [Cycloclasticus sp.]|nr:acyltransferase [Cycloclasticus sp.]
MKNSSSTQYEWVNYAKGIGIILVVYGHVARGVFNAGMTEDEMFFRLVDAVIYSFHMPLFFFLSGLFFVGSLCKRGGKNLVSSKLATIAYPYILWSLIQGGLSYSLQGITNFKTTVTDVLSLLWLPHDQFWFLYALFVVFVFYTLAYSLFQNVLVLFVLSLFLYIFKGDLRVSWSVANAAINFGVYFCAGMLFSRYKANDLKVSYFWVLATVVVFALSQYCFHNQFYTGDIVKLMMAFIGIGMVVVISKLIGERFNTLRLLGRCSLEIYLLHVIFGSGFRIIMQYFFNIENSAFHLIFGTLVGAFISLVFTEVIKRMNLNFLFHMPKHSVNQNKA